MLRNEKEHPSLNVVRPSLTDEELMGETVFASKGCCAECHVPNLSFCPPGARSGSTGFYKVEMRGRHAEASRAAR
jgi:hypothetical protein